MGFEIIAAIGSAVSVDLYCARMQTLAVGGLAQRHADSLGTLDNIAMQHGHMASAVSIAKALEPKPWSK
jgi:hypothetical protein